MPYRYANPKSIEKNYNKDSCRFSQPHFLDQTMLSDNIEQVHANGKKLQWNKGSQRSFQNRIAYGHANYKMLKRENKKYMCL